MKVIEENKGNAFDVRTVGIVGFVVRAARPARPYRSSPVLEIKEKPRSPRESASKAICKHSISLPNAAEEIAINIPTLNQVYPLTPARDRAVYPAAI